MEKKKEKFNIDCANLPEHQKKILKEYEILKKIKKYSKKVGKDVEFFGLAEIDKLVIARKAIKLTRQQERAKREELIKKLKEIKKEDNRYSVDINWVLEMLEKC